MNGRGGRPGVDELVAHAPVGLVIIGADASLLWANQRWLDDCGRSTLPDRDEALASIVDPDERARVAHAIQALLERPGEFSDQITVRRPDGGVRHHRLRVASIVRPDGTVDGAASTVSDVTDLEEARRAARVHEERYHRLLLDAPIRQVLASLDGTVIEANDAFHRLCGVEDGTLTGASFLDLLPLRADGRTSDQVAELLAGTVPAVHVEERLVRADGTEIWVNGTVGITDHDGQTVFHAAAQDISERRQVEEALRTSEGMLRAVLDSLHEAVLVYDHDGVLAYNRAAVELTGFDEDRLGDRSLWAALDPVDLDGNPVPLREGPSLTTLRTGVPVRDHVAGWLHPEVGRRWMLSSSTPLLIDDQLRGTVLSFSDITERKEAEDARRAAQEENERLARIVESTSDLVGLVDFPSGRILYLNASARRLYGLEEADVTAMHFRDLFADVDARSWKVALPRLLQGKGWTGESAMRAADGSVVHVWQSFTPEMDEFGELARISSVGRDVTARLQLEAELAHQASHDSLTGLPNRARLLELLDELLEAPQGPARRADDPHEGPQAAVLFLDLDRFKQVNDSLGHDAGDELLCEVARRITVALRPEDTVARLGGDEFVLLCPGIADEAHARSVAQRVVSAVEGRPIQLGTATVRTTVSVGIALAHPGVHPEVLLRDADAAMYRAKELGRARMEVFDESLRVRAAARTELANDLLAGIERGEISVLYQPTIDITTGAVTAVEALARWDHPRLGRLDPATFIPLAEETGLIVGLGLVVLTEACREAAGWTGGSGGAPDVHVNLSAPQLATPSLPRLVSEILEGVGLPAHRLCLEMTESVLMDDAVASLEALQRLADVGVRLALDDFGTGYSSLSYLQRFPVDVVKVDRSFVDGLGSDPVAATIVEAIVNLATTLGLEAIAEGVETEAQLDWLRSQGYRWAQGFLFSRPVPAEELTALLARRFTV